MPKPLLQVLFATALFTATGLTAHGSSHREALAILNEPCADNTDTYAWVSPGSHDKLYLIMNFNPLHEPGQGNQGLRACNGYRYEFHIGIGASLKDKLVYRVEFKNTLTPEAPPSSTDALGGGNELLWQLTGGAETMTVSRTVPLKGGNLDDDSDGDGDLDGDGFDRRVVVLGKDLPVLPNNHGPQTDRLVYGLGAFAGYDSGDPTSREVGLYDQAFVDTFIHPLGNGGRVIAGQFDDPYQLDEKGIFDLVNLNTDDLGGIPGARRPPGKDVFRSATSSHKASHTTACSRPTRPTVCSGYGRALAVKECRASIPATSSPVSRGPAPSCRSVETPCRSSTPASLGLSVRPVTCAATPSRT